MLDKRLDSYNRRRLEDIDRARHDKRLIALLLKFADVSDEPRSLSSVLFVISCPDSGFTALRGALDLKKHLSQDPVQLALWRCRRIRITKTEMRMIFSFSIRVQKAVGIDLIQTLKLVLLQMEYMAYVFAFIALVFVR